jgi:crossover junction endodeoxyribonuclease RusA
MLTGPLTLLLPWPPSGNHATKHTTTGAHYLTAEHKRFRSAVKWIAYQMRAPTIASPYRCAIVWYPPDRRERDSDNLQKVTFDALRHAGVIEGDSMADKIAYSEVVVMPAKPGEGAVSVRIERA